MVSDNEDDVVVDFLEDAWLPLPVVRHDWEPPVIRTDMVLEDGEVNAAKNIHKMEE